MRTAEAGRRIDAQQTHRRLQRVAAARVAMEEAGVDWATVRVWAETDGGYRPADVKTINPAAVAAYLGRDLDALIDRAKAAEQPDQPMTARVASRPGPPPSQPPAAPSEPVEEPDSPPGKRCSGCDQTKPLDAFGTLDSSPDGRFWRCLDCEQARDRARLQTPTRAARNRAYHRAQAALVKAHPEEFDRLYQAELAAAVAEIAQHQAAAPTGDPHKPIPLIKPGPAVRGQSRVARLREDVGRCPACHDAHDRGHVCPSCGTAPEQPEQAQAAAHG